MKVEEEPYTGKQEMKGRSHYRVAQALEAELPMIEFLIRKKTTPTKQSYTVGNAPKAFAGGGGEAPQQNDAIYGLRSRCNVTNRTPIVSPLVCLFGLLSYL